MTPDQMSALHHAAFQDARGWSAQEFSDLCAQPYVQALSADHGFALIRTLAGESELLTLAVDPAHRRKGIAQGLLRHWLEQLQGTAQTAFLEVAADNHAARALYAQAGFAIIATRTGYYQRRDAPSVDALILQCDLTTGQHGQ